MRIIQILKDLIKKIYLFFINNYKIYLNPVKTLSHKNESNNGYKITNSYSVTSSKSPLSAEF